MAGAGRTAIAAAGAAVLGVALAGISWRSRDVGGEPPPAVAEPQILFDDFDQRDRRALAASGWLVRSAEGEPGIPGAAWGGVALVAAPGLLRLTATTDGSADGTVQAQVCHASTDGVGTSAARVRLRDAPVAGPRVDSAAQAFAADGAFSFTYRPGDRRDGAAPTLEVTAPGGASRSIAGSRAGWHVLVAQVGDRSVTYYADGARLAVRRGRPRGATALALGHWLERIGAGPARRYEEDVDWVFHLADAVLTPDQVDAAVTSLRRIGVGFQDSVTRARASTGSPCGPS